MDVWERVMWAAEREMKGKGCMVRWELCSAVPNKWVLSVNINTEIVYWQKPCSTEMGCCRWRFDSQLFSFKTYKVASCPPSCEFTIWMCMQGGRLYIKSVIKDCTSCNVQIFHPMVENLQFPKLGGNCWKAVASCWVCWHFHSMTGTNNK